MKIRIQGNAVRLRLTRSEIELFRKDGYVEEKTEFVRNSFTYSIQKLFDGTTMDASFTGEKLTVYVPNKIAEEWTNSETISFSHHLPLGSGKSLFLLIEKDFKCIDGESTEDQSDYYDNPLKNC